MRISDWSSDVCSSDLDPDIAHEVMAMMQTVTEPGGTAKDAAILGYPVAGKNGTARIASGGGYSRRYAAVFDRLVPVDNPRFSMAVVGMKNAMSGAVGKSVAVRVEIGGSYS